MRRLTIKSVSDVKNINLNVTDGPRSQTNETGKMIFSESALGWKRLNLDHQVETIHTNKRLPLKKWVHLQIHMLKLKTFKNECDR